MSDLIDNSVAVIYDLIEVNEMADNNKSLLEYQDDVQVIKTAIIQSRTRTAVNANTDMLGLYYGVGEYISINTRSNKWGTGAIESISEQLQFELPGLRGFSPSNMKNMRTFFEQWVFELEPNRQPAAVVSKLKNELLLIRQPLAAELDNVKMTAFRRVGFTHHCEILRKCKTTDERWYYILRCADEFWGKRTLIAHLKANDYKTYGSLPNNFKLTIPENNTIKLATRSFRDEYLIDYIDIKDSDDYDERDVGDGIVAKITKFLMTMGEGFCFIKDQYRIIIDGDEFFVDLLFYERNLQCLVAIELKKDKFRPADLGQLSFYLSALDKYVRKPNENNTIGILLCEEMKNKTVVELAVQDYNKPMGVATYRLGTDIPEPYAALLPLIDGVQHILSENEK
jgi:predicted nuclease of restriction endonuclease-like (RecB) superfamily